MSAYSFGDSSMEGPALRDVERPALRDVERWKDKIEVHLDNRQVFFLFFGSALVACLLFILGVIVGKRLESRGRADAPAVADPLALLDKVAAAPAAAAEQELTFPKALLGNSAGKGKPVVAAPAPRPAAPVAAPAATVPAVAAPAKPAATAAAPVVAPKPAVAAVAPAAAPKPAAAPAAAPKPVLAAAPAAAPAPTAKAPSAPAKPALATQGVKVASTQSAIPAAPAAAAAAKKYTLQLSSFQDRAEAESYAKRFGPTGAYIVTSEVPDKGTWYRVRVGTFGSSQEALSAKSAFEKKHNVIAYIALR